MTGRETSLTSNLIPSHMATQWCGYNRPGPVQNMPSCIRDRCKGLQGKLILLGSGVCINLKLALKINC